MPCTGSREGNPLWASNAACSALHSFPNYSWGLICFFFGHCQPPTRCKPMVWLLGGTTGWEPHG